MKRVDPFTRVKRSEIMANIKARGNVTTELRFRKLLRRSGIRGWRRHGRRLPGSPDFYFPKQHVAVFIDGCFWHGCKRCSKGRLPQNNAAFWRKKIDLNMKRDRRVARQLRNMGWKVLRFWEHRLQDTEESVLKAVWRAIEN